MRETLVKSEEFKDSPVGRVPKNWKVVNLASVCQRITDGSHQSVKTSDEGVPFLYVSCVRDGQILWEQAAKITETTYSEISKGREPKPGLILYTAVGSYGHAALVRENCKFSFQRHIAYILPNAESVAPEYLVRWLNSPQGRKYADQVALGNAQKTVTLSSLADFPVLLPSLEEQEGIAAILNSIDQAIAHTSSLIAKLKQMKAGLLHDLLTRGLDENGELRDAIAHPEQFKDSPLGRIPKDWTVLSLNEVGTWLSGGTPNKGVSAYWNGKIPWVSPKDMKQLYLEDTINHITDTGANAGTRIVLPETVFIVVRGMILAHSFPIGIALREMAFNQDIKAVTCSETVSFLYLAYWLMANSSNLLRLVTESTHGTKRFDLKDLLSYQIAIPSRPEQEQIIKILDTYDTRIRAEEAYRDKLKFQKQGLMHDLLTGKVRVKDA
jgi:type I restriction enzyme S subunit